MKVAEIRVSRTEEVVDLQMRGSSEDLMALLTYVICSMKDAVTPAMPEEEQKFLSDPVHVAGSLLIDTCFRDAYEAEAVGGIVELMGANNYAAMRLDSMVKALTSTLSDFKDEGEED